jgi:Tfp pilus assembly protein PilN
LRINLLPVERSAKPSVSVKPAKRKMAESKAERSEIIENESVNPRITAKKRSNVLIYICWGVFLLGSLVFLLGEYSEYDPAIVELTSLSEQVAQYREDLAAERQAQKIEPKIDNRQPELALIAHMYQPWLAVINGLASALPEEVWLTGIEGANEDSIHVKCRSLTVTAAQDYIRNLQSNTLFSDVQFQEMKQISPGIPDYAFTLEIKTREAAFNVSEK